MEAGYPPATLTEVSQGVSGTENGNPDAVKDLTLLSPLVWYTHGIHGRDDRGDVKSG
jgi:hypothetical protein